MTDRSTLTQLPLILYKMLLRSFLNWFLIAQGLFVVMFLIADLFLRIDSYINNKVTITNILFLTALAIPKGAWLTMPIAIMFGIIMTIGSLYQGNELVAIYTSGISLAKFTLPLILFNILLSFAMIFVDSYMVIPANRYKERLFERATNNSRQNMSNNQDVTIRSESGDYFWHADNFNTQENRLEQVIIFKIDSNYRIIYRLDAANAVYTKSGWLFKSITIREWDENGTITKEERFNKRVIESFEETPSIFKLNEYDINNLTLREAKERIRTLKKLNIDYKKDLTNYYKKYSFPFTLLIVALFAIGVSTVSRINILIIALFFSIGLAVLYYVLQMILDILAYTGQIPSILGAWLPFIISLPISIYLVVKSKT